MDRSARSAVLLLLLLALVVGGILALQAAMGPHLGGASSAAGASGVRVRATVIGISDGDTIRVRLDDGTVERVRYVGIDAPEIAHPQDGIAAECFGPEAASADAALVDGHEVWLERDVSDRDRFGASCATSGSRAMASTSWWQRSSCGRGWPRRAPIRPTPPATSRSSEPRPMRAPRGAASGARAEQRGPGRVGRPKGASARSSIRHANVVGWSHDTREGPALRRRLASRADS